MEDLQKIAAATNSACQVEPGFQSCSVIGKPSSGLCFAFDTLQNAEAYKFKRELSGGTFPMSIQGPNIIEDRQEKVPPIASAPVKENDQKKWWQFWKWFS